MKYRIVSSIILILLINACTTRQVKRLDESTQMDLSGRWNDTDSRLVAEEMINDGLSRRWLTDFFEANSKKPTVIVGMIKNKTHEIISTGTFIKDIERAYVNSGKVRLVQAGEAREELRDERADQQEFASTQSIKKWGLEKGADLMLQGVIDSIVDQLDNRKVVIYQIDMELTDIQTNEKVWIGSKKIKKYIKN
ncbi:penicillin-binding protein activator LpoB [bacterium]|nr:penicillin-binding protein activator LpoB [candidate division CSSED10-310 bacterium]